MFGLLKLWFGPEARDRRTRRRRANAYLCRLARAVRDGKDGLVVTGVELPPFGRVCATASGRYEGWNVVVNLRGLSGYYTDGLDLEASVRVDDTEFFTDYHGTFRVLQELWNRLEREQKMRRAESSRAQDAKEQSMAGRM